MQKVSGKRVFHLVGELNVDAIRTLSTWYRESVVSFRDEWLSLMISSGGGWVDGTFGFIDYMIGIEPCHLQTIAAGQVSSMAIPLFLAGEHRVVTPRTTFFLHELGRSFRRDDRWATSELQTQTECLEVSQRFYCDFIARRTAGKFPVEKIREMMKVGKMILASEAVELGIAHEISPDIPE